VLCSGAMLRIPAELAARRCVVSVGRGLARLLPGLLAPLAGRKIALVAGRRVLAMHGGPVAIHEDVEAGEIRPRCGS
jgi:hypothetical protein